MTKMTDPELQVNEKEAENEGENEEGKGEGTEEKEAEKDEETNVEKNESAVDPRKGAKIFCLSMQNSPLCAPNRRTMRKIFSVVGLFLWMFGLCFGIFGAVRVISSTWRRYQEYPTVISMERDYKEWNTSFPAVTICPLEKYDNNSLNELVEVLPYKDKLQLRDFLIALAQATYGTFHLVPEFSEINSSDYMGLVLAIRHKFSYAVSGSSEANGATFLTPTITEHGLCYAYNSDIAIYNSPEYWESRSSTAFYSKGWSFVGSPLDGDVFAQIMDMSSGYIVYIHGSNETADFSSQSLRSELGRYKTLFLTALSIYSTEETRGLSVEQRDCRFGDESNLMISPVYSYNLCRNQCRMKLAYGLCNCVPHFYKPHHKLRICDVKGIHCLDKHRDLLISLRNPLTGKKVQCNCVPACNDVNYVIESEHNMPWFLGTNLKFGISNYPRMRLKRDVIFGFKDVLVAVGSSIALFLGCSLLRIMEILYFICIRLYRSIRMLSKGICSCIFSEIFGGKYRYLTSASSDRSRVSPTLIPVQSAETKKANNVLNPCVVQHI